MRLTAWQQQSKLLNSARDLLDKNETVRGMMEVAREESPANLPSFIGSTEAEHSRRLGYIEGYHHCLRIIEATGAKPVVHKPLEATFEKPKE